MPDTSHPPKVDDAELIQLSREIIQLEAEGVSQLADTLPDALLQTLDLIHNRAGNIIVIGIGKSGHIGRKIAATLSSTGNPAFFLHATEACHGDSGVIDGKDVILAISQSGESDELNVLLPLFESLQVPIVAITGQPQSTLASKSHQVISSAVKREACPLNVAPTTSTTVALVIGDVLAMCLLKMKGFSADDFARSHPAGHLGRKLLLRVRDLMLTGEQLPRVLPDTVLSEAILEISRKALGVTVVVDQQDKILGVFTDGDLRRTLQDKVDIHQEIIGHRMTRNFHTIDPAAPAVEGVQVMQKNKITSLVVPDQQQRLTGILTMHELIRKRLV